MLEKMSDFFENRLDGYDKHMMTNIESATEFYPYTANLLPANENSRILDLGCGTGLELEFYYHQTEGKSIAQKAGLDNAVENRTVSLSNRTRLNYRFLNNGAADTTIMLPFYVSSEASGSPELLLQFSGAWERLQIEPFFSNTFGKVTYQVGLEHNEEIFQAAAPKVVFQFIYENELSELLP